MKRKIWGKWFKEIDITLNDFANWLNSWADVEKYVRNEPEEERKAFRNGYEKAVGNVYDKLGLNYELFDKRTKTGYRK